MRLATAVVVSAGLGVAGIGLTAHAKAEPGFAPAPMYHWCPGDDWLPEYGFNWEWSLCHDDHHRDIDGGDHRFDWRGAPPPGALPAPWYPPPSSGPPLWWRP